MLRPSFPSVATRGTKFTEHEWKKALFSCRGTVQILLVSFQSSSLQPRKGRINNVCAFQCIFLHSRDAMSAVIDPTSSVHRICSLCTVKQAL